MVNKEQFEGKWQEFKGKVKEKWGKLTDDDLTQINGKREQLLGKLEQRYGYAKERAEKELADWETHFGRECDESCSNKEHHHEKHKQHK